MLAHGSLTRVKRGRSDVDAIRWQLKCCVRAPLLEDNYCETPIASRPRQWEELLPSDHPNRARGCEVNAKVSCIRKTLKSFLGVSYYEVEKVINDPRAKNISLHFYLTNV